MVERVHRHRRTRLACREDWITCALIMLALGGGGKQAVVRVGEAAIGMHMELGFMPAAKRKGAYGGGSSNMESSDGSEYDYDKEEIIERGDNDESDLEGWTEVEENLQVMLLEHVGVCTSDSWC